MADGSMDDLSDRCGALNLGSLWSDLVRTTDEFQPRSNSGRRLSSMEANEFDGSSIGRLLAQTYSYSSESCSSPCVAAPKPASLQEVAEDSPVFKYSDDSPVSHGSNNSSPSCFKYGTSLALNRSRTSRIESSSSFSDPDSPTMDEVLLMGSRTAAAADRSIFDPLTGKLKEANFSGLTGSFGSGSESSPTNSPSDPLLSSPEMRSPGNSLLHGSFPPRKGSSLLYQPTSVSSGYGRNLSSIPVDVATLAKLQTALLTPSVVSDLLEGGIMSDSPVPHPLHGVLASSAGYALDPYSIEKAAKMHRSAAAVCEATCTWSGQLPYKNYKNCFYSCKVFLGGVPWDITEATLKQTFINFGNIQVEWPGKENSASPPRGYVYILFENEKQVRALLAACSQDFSIGGNYYYKISSRRMRQKEVQVIPWVIGDSNYVRCPSYQLDPAKTVFVGALHGMLNAEALANIMNDLFGGVVYCGIDTDKYKYPIGSARVTFNNSQTFRKAVKAAFVEIKTPKFTKKIQIDPYLADALCQLCSMQQGPYFCRDESCFKYFCRSCWQLTHPATSHGTHKPLMRSSKLRAPQTPFNRVI